MNHPGLPQTRDSWFGWRVTTRPSRAQVEPAFNQVIADPKCKRIFVLPSAQVGAKTLHFVHDGIHGLTHQVKHGELLTELSFKRRLIWITTKTAFQQMATKLKRKMAHLIWAVENSKEGK